MISDINDDCDVCVIIIDCFERLLMHLMQFNDNISLPKVGRF